MKSSYLKYALKVTEKKAFWDISETSFSKTAKHCGIFFSILQLWLRHLRFESYLEFYFVSCGIFPSSRISVQKRVKCIENVAEVDSPFPIQQSLRQRWTRHLNSQCDHMLESKALLEIPVCTEKREEPNFFGLKCLDAKNIKWIT